MASLTWRHSGREAGGDVIVGIIHKEERGIVEANLSTQVEPRHWLFILQAVMVRLHTMFYRTQYFTTFYNHATQR